MALSSSLVWTILLDREAACWGYRIHPYAASSLGTHYFTTTNARATDLFPQVVLPHVLTMVADETDDRVRS